MRQGIFMKYRRKSKELWPGQSNVIITVPYVSLQNMELLQLKSLNTSITKEGHILCFYAW